MTNDERNPKPECRRTLWCAAARSSFGFRYSFGFRHSSFGFENRGSWRACFRLFAYSGFVADRSRKAAKFLELATLRDWVWNDSGHRMARMKSHRHAVLGAQGDQRVRLDFE